MNVRELLVRSSLRMVLQTLMAHEQVRSLVLHRIEKRLYKETLEHKSEQCPHQVRQDKLDCVAAILRGVDHTLGKGMVSKAVMRGMLESFLGNVVLNEDSVAAVERLGYLPPAFITISPTGKCNLKCKGCYAADAALRGSQLDFKTLDRILEEKRELWGSHFTVISGGEPFLWEDSGCDLISLAERHPRDVFMIYTNGTLINDETARRMADVGNMTPAISVEGFEAETDARRGKGVHRRIMTAFENLRAHGIPFGISATGCRDNWEVITSEEFADFYFIEQGAIYGWLFQYMPIGRGQSLEMVVPPEARVQMLERMWRLVRERKVFMADFWNSGTASMGCISAGRGGGYFYINWDGDITPCVFAPYACDNIHDLYARGDDLSAVIDSPLFSRIREWQRDYGYDKPAHEVGNWLCPCPIRDHFGHFSDVVRQCHARPITEEAKQAVEDPEYYRGMVDYGDKIRELTDPIWEEQYLHSSREARLYHEARRNIGSG
ncbi:MAG: hypothetical protein A2Z18_00660 [Armatimonadetes bacterium RBG_16_58_9]|nr:MAG: hypothetical protein A2Z18_00660 [Armatimonadetes bacterium RBG_16_58_9]